MFFCFLLLSAGVFLSVADISFHFTLPKEGELIGPAVGSTPPPVSQLKQTLRHSTPIGGFSKPGKQCRPLSDSIWKVCFYVLKKFCLTFCAEIAPFSEKPCGGGDDAAADGEDGKLSLRMKLVTPVEEGGSERFSLQSKSRTPPDFLSPSDFPSPSDSHDSSV